MFKVDDGECGIELWEVVDVVIILKDFCLNESMVIWIVWSWENLIKCEFSK